MLRLAVLATTATVASLLVPAAASAAAPPTCFGKKATIVGTKKADRLVGTDRVDVIVGLGGDDVIRGSRGNDLICGGSGTDRLWGGPGDDRINGGFGRYYRDRSGNHVVPDRIWPGTGDDLVVPVYDDRGDYGERDQVLLSENGVGVTGATVDVLAHKVVAAHGTDRIAPQPNGRPALVEYVGSVFADTMLGGPGRDVFHGNDGADRLIGGGGPDALDDSVAWRTEQRADADTLDGGPGADKLTGGRGNDRLIGGDGDDHLIDTGRSPDVLDAGSGNDELSDRWVLGRGTQVAGGSGHDRISVGAPATGYGIVKRITVDRRIDEATLHGDREVVAAYTGIEGLDVVDVPLTFFGTAAGETVSVFFDVHRLVAYGFGGNDTFFGSVRDDVINGGPGRDFAVPRAGRDRCVSVERQHDDDRCEVND